MQYGKEFVGQTARRLVRLVDVHRLPVDLYSIAQYQGVHTIQFAPIVPDGVTSPDKSGFTIHLRSEKERTMCLRDPRERKVPLSNRQRFTLAHEIVHTFFHFRERETLKPALPQGGRPERLCQFGAGLLVVPDHHLYACIGHGGPLSSAAQAMRLCQRFGVSPEVLLRRIGEDHGLIETDSALIFGKNDGKENHCRILVACCGLTLMAFMPAPRPFADLPEWLGVHAGRRNPSFRHIETWCRSISESERLCFSVIPWSARASTFFLQIRLARSKATDMLV